jgi:hypothetical protein
VERDGPLSLLPRSSYIFGGMTMNNGSRHTTTLFGILIYHLHLGIAIAVVGKVLVNYPNKKNNLIQKLIRIKSAFRYLLFENLFPQRAH